jgi:hypothetical protein
MDAEAADEQEYDLEEMQMPTISSESDLDEDSTEHAGIVFEVKWSGSFLHTMQL